jgi:hypothetical protein
MSYHKLLVSIVVSLFSTGAIAKTVSVGTCLGNRQSYSSISAAISAVPAGSTILICPGTYPEQVTIGQPMTLRGMQIGNSASTILTVPPGGLTKSVIDPQTGTTVFSQILVQGTEAGLVNISDIGIDGNNNQVVAGVSLTGIYYQNSSGEIRNVATYNQTGNASGFGIFLEATTSTPKTVTVSDSSIHDFNADGINAGSNIIPTSLTVNIKSNSVISSNTFSGKAVNAGISVQGTAGSITGNRVITHPASAGVSPGIGIVFTSNTTVSNNTVENWFIWALGDSNLIKANTVSLFSTGLVISGNNNTAQNNLILDITDGGAGISFNCTGTGNTVTHNIINDSDLGIIDDPGGNVVSPNSFSNVTSLVFPPCDI